MKASARALLLLALAWSTAAAPPDVARLSEVIEVRLVSIDVVVTDSAGRHVRGLTARDFEVYDSGKVQEITNFSEVSGEGAGTSLSGAQHAPTAPPDLTPRHYVIFFDCISTSALERQRTAPAVARLIEHLRPADDMMIVSWNRRLRVVTRPTNDPARLNAALDQTVREISLGSQPLSSIFPDVTGPVSAIGVSAADQARTAGIAAKEGRSDFKTTVKALAGVLSTLRGVGGHKAVVVISSGLTAPPDESLSEAVDLIPAGDSANVLSGLALMANGAAATLYALSPKGLNTPGQFASGASVLDTPTADPSDLGLRYVAAATGGLAATNTNGFVAAADRLSDDLSHYYSIGYRMPTARDNRERRIRIRTRNASYTVRHRDAVVQRTADKEVADTVRSSLLFPIAANDLAIVASAGKATRARGRVMIPVDVKIPLSSLTFAPDFGGAAADLSIFVGSCDAAGAMSEVRRFHEVVRAKRQQPKGTHTYGMDIDLRTATEENRVVVGVLDNTSGATGFATIAVSRTDPDDFSRRSPSK